MSKKGIVTAKKAGKATITAKTSKGNAKFIISVDAPEARTRIDLENFVTSRGTEQPAEDAFFDDEVEYVLPLSEDGISVVYEVESESFRFVDASNASASENPYEFRIILDMDTEYDISNFIFYIGDNMYSAAVKPTKYTANSSLVWNGLDANRQDIEVSEEEQEALSKIAVAEFYKIGKAVKNGTGIQMRDLGFYKVALFK